MQLENQIAVKSKPAVITANFDQLRAALSKELQRYDVKVTKETVAEAKKLCTELNKTRQHIATVRKEQAAIASEPVRQFEEQMKSFELDVESSRVNLKKQVEFFEEDRKILIAKKLLEYKIECIEQIGLREEFQKIDHTHLIILSSFTDKDNLTAKAKTGIEDLVKGAKDAQDNVDRRLLELENKCLRAGLHEPLEKEHVSHFLFADDESYSTKLEQLITVEIERQTRAESARNAKQQEFNAARANAETDRAVEIIHAGAASIRHHEQPKAEPVNGKIRLTVNCQFEIEVKEGTAPNAIESAYRKRLKEAGFKTLSNVTIRPTNAVFS